MSRRGRSRGVPMVAKRWQQEVPVQLKVEASKVKGGDTELVARHAVLPFLPRYADELGVGVGADYMTVDTVYWCEEDGITVWLSDADGDGRLEQLLAAGWEPSN